MVIKFHKTNNPCRDCRKSNSCLVAGRFRECKIFRAWVRYVLGFSCREIYAYQRRAEEEREIDPDVSYQRHLDWMVRACSWAEITIEQIK